MSKKITYQVVSDDLRNTRYSRADPEKWGCKRIPCPFGHQKPHRIDPLWKDNHENRKLR